MNNMDITTGTAVAKTACGKKEENNVDNKKEENRAESIAITNIVFNVFFILYLPFI